MKRRLLRKDERYNDVKGGTLGIFIAIRISVLHFIIHGAACKGQCNDVHNKVETEGEPGNSRINYRRHVAGT